MNKKVLIIGGNGLVGAAIADALRQDYQVVLTAGHHEIKGGYKLSVDNTEGLMTILNMEDPAIIISSIRGDYGAQFKFHEELADWVSGKSKRMMFISTANVFDGDLSQPWTEDALPDPQSDYGKYKKACEEMLRGKLSEQLIVFRLPAVWAPNCPRIRQLKEYGNSGKPLATVRGVMVNVILAEQIGKYAKFVLDHDLSGIFHVGSTDTVDYFEFQKMVCDKLRIKQPEFNIEVSTEPAFQAVIPSRKEIPQNLLITVAEVLNFLK